MDYEQYWNSVLGQRTPSDVVTELDLGVDDGVADARRALREWLDCAEVAAALAGADCPGFSPHRDRALGELLVACCRAAAAELLPVESGEAVYLTWGGVELGRDGCQPSGSLCIVTGPAEDLPDECDDAIADWLG